MPIPTMRIKPVDGRKVRDPVTKHHIPADGLDVPATGPASRYWLRRIRGGDVVHVAEVVVQHDQISDSTTKDEA